MKKGKAAILRAIPVFVLCLLAAALFSMTAFADDDGYYYKSMDMSFEVGTDKSVRVCEVLTVDFVEDRHGIIRSVGMSGAVEDCTLTDLEVDGAPYTYDGYGEIKIGDPDRLVRGEQTYIITYTLHVNADASPQYDFFYMNVIGSQFDTRIERASAKIIFPNGAKIVSSNLTSGSYGSRDSYYADIVSDTTIMTSTIEGAMEAEGDNVINIQSSKTLPSYTSISIEVRLEEGAFPDAPVVEPDMVIDDLAISMKANEYGDISVTEKYTFTPYSAGGRFSRVIDELTEPYGSTVGFYVSEIEVEAMDCASGVELKSYNDSDWIVINLYALKPETQYHFTLSYTLKTYKQDYSTLNFPFVFSGAPHVHRIDKMTVNANLDHISDVFVKSMYNAQYSLENPFVSKRSGNSLVCTLKDPLAANDELEIKVYFIEPGFVRRTSSFDYIIPALAGISAALAGAFVVTRKEKQLVPAVEYYPPENLSPAEVGYIIDGEVSSADITSLIYYWASQGHLEISFTSKKDFTLYKKYPLDDAHRQYEKVLYNALWTYGKDGAVKNTELEEKFYVRINSAMRALPKLYKDENAIEDKGSRVKSVLMLLASVAVPLVAAIVAAGKFRFDASGNIFMIVSAAAMFFAAGALCCGMKKWKAKKGWKALWWRIPLAALLFIFGGLMISGLANKGIVSESAALITALCVVAGTAASAWITKRTDRGTELLGKCVGFRDFLKTAEKSKLEMLIAEDPDYYYNILPYAQVLGVSAVWEEKFKGLLTTPPTWCTSTTAWSGMHMASMMRSSMTGMSRSMTSMPASSSGGSGGGGYGGGFGGGGFSGGGFGGGGGSSW